MSRSGPKTTPTNHGPREKQSDKEQRSQHAKTPVHQKEKSSEQGCGQNHRILKRLLKNCTKVKIDFENRCLLQHPFLCKALSRCLHSITLQMSRVQASERVDHEISTSVTISTKSTTNFESSGSMELIRSHHNVRDQWLLMQGTKVQNKWARRKVAKNWLDTPFT